MHRRDSVRFRFTYLVMVTDPGSPLFGKRYYGKHSTCRMDDGYVGSSPAILEYVRNHGRDGVERTVLEFFGDDESLAAAELSLVSRMMDSLGSDCLNRRRGSCGGFGAAHAMIMRLPREERAIRARAASLAKAKAPEAVRESWRGHCREAHRRQSPEARKRRYDGVSRSLRRYYASEDWRMNREKRNEVNRESNRRTATIWRREFASVFGATPESFRASGLMGSAMKLYKAVKAGKECSEDEIRRIVEATHRRG